MKCVKLKSGIDVSEAMVELTMAILKSLFDEGLGGVVLFIDLVEKCKDKSFEMSPNTEELLKERSLMQGDGSVHDTIRDIVLSAIVGEGFELQLISPLANRRGETS